MPEIPNFFKDKLSSIAKITIQPRLEAEVEDIVRKAELKYTLEDFYRDDVTLERPDQDVFTADQAYYELEDQVRLPLKQKRTLILFDRQISLPGKKVRSSS